MRVGVKVGGGVVAVVMAGSALSVGAGAGAAEPPPGPEREESVLLQQLSPRGEEGQGPGAIFVGPAGAARAEGRLQHHNAQRARWCHGTVMVSLLAVREGPGLGYAKVGNGLQRGKRLSTNWSGIVRNDGYLWAPLRNGTWVADYKLGNGNGKWYVKYSDCR